MKSALAAVVAATLVAFCDGISKIPSADGRLVGELPPITTAEERVPLAAFEVRASSWRFQQIPLSQAWPSLLLATVAGMSTVIGGLVVFGMDGAPPPKAMAFSLSLAAGVMVAVSVEMLWPHAHDGDGHSHHDNKEEEDRLSWTTVLMLFLVGALLCFFLSLLGDKFAEYVVAETEEPEDGRPNERSPEDGAAEVPASDAVTQTVAHKKESMRLAFLLFVSLTAHNFPEGFAVAVTTLSSRQLGVMICFAIALHNIPEGIAIAVSTYDATLDKWRALRMTAYSGLSEPLGALCALLLLQSVLSPRLIQALLTVVAGIMCYVALAELLPEALSKKETAWTVVGFIAGIAVMLATHEALEYYSEEHGSFDE